MDEIRVAAVLGLSIPKTATASSALKEDTGRHNHQTEIITVTKADSEMNTVDIDGSVSVVENSGTQMCC